MPHDELLHAADARRLVLFTKPARPGRVKTRLIPALGAEQAAALHRAFLGDLLARLLTGRWALEIAWALDEEETMPERTALAVELGLAPGALAAVAMSRQFGGDLGERMHETMVGGRPPLVAIVGSDHPELALEVVEEAFVALATGAALLFVPAHDGGYTLVGARVAALRAEWFAGVDWSTCRVLAQSVANARRTGVEPVLLAAAADVDTPADLVALARRLGLREPAPAAPARGPAETPAAVCAAVPMGGAELAGAAPDCPRTIRLLGDLLPLLADREGSDGRRGAVGGGGLHRECAPARRSGLC